MAELGDRKPQQNNESFKKHQWKKGQSGNPKGRPKKAFSITSLAKEMLDEQADYISPHALPQDKTWRQMIVRAWLKKCAEGDISAIRELNERLEGRASQIISGANGEPIILKVVYEKIRL